MAREVFEFRSFSEKMSLLRHIFSCGAKSLSDSPEPSIGCVLADSWIVFALRFPIVRDVGSISYKIYGTCFLHYMK